MRERVARLHPLQLAVLWAVALVALRAVEARYDLGDVFTLSSAYAAAPWSLRAPAILGALLLLWVTWTWAGGRRRER